MILLKMECTVVKDLSRLDRDHIAVSYHLEILFPSKGVRFVSVNDQFDTIDSMTSQNKEHPSNLALVFHLLIYSTSKYLLKQKWKSR